MTPDILHIMSGISVKITTGKKGSWPCISGNGERAVIEMKEGELISIKGADPDNPGNVLAETSWTLEGEKKVTIRNISIPLEDLALRAPKNNVS